jgi:thiamine-phosphate pyrophosphorylase
MLPAMPNVATWRGLYAIVDPEHCAGRDPRTVASAILAGGCAVLQLRDKRDAALRAALATELHALCRAASVPFVVNDDLELALALGADGVHLGQSDLPVESARIHAGRALAIGLSTHDLGQAQAAHARGADLIGFGPVFATVTKLDPDPVVGIAGLREVCAHVPLPVVAIGGIGADNIAEVRAAGCKLAAVISAVCAAPDPRAAAARLHRALID